jgi:WD40-like Beta Propeller Repeat
MSRRLLSAFFVIATSLTCAHPAKLATHSHDVLYVFTESPTLFVIDPAVGRVIATPALSAPHRTSPVFSSDSSTLYFTSEDSSAGGVFALDTRSFAVRRVLDGKRLGLRSEDSLKLFGFMLATAPGRGELFDGSGMVHDRPRAFPQSTQRIVAIDTALGAVTSASTALSIMSLTPLPAGPAAPKGALIILPLGTPRARDMVGSLVLFDPASHRVIDSLSIPKYTPGTEPSGSVPFATELVRSVVPSPDGRRVYVLAWNSVYGFDLVTRKLFAVIHASCYDGRVAVSPDGTRVYFVEDKFDPGPRVISRFPAAPRMPFVLPPSRIRVFDANLVEGSSIPFGVQFTPDSPATRPLSIVVSRDNASLYLTATEPGSHGKGELHLLVMSAASGKIVHDIPMGVRGGGSVLVGN